MSSIESNAELDVNHDVGGDVEASRRLVFSAAPGLDPSHSGDLVGAIAETGEADRVEHQAPTSTDEPAATPSDGSSAEVPSASPVDGASDDGDDDLDEDQDEGGLGPSVATEAPTVPKVTAVRKLAEALTNQGMSEGAAWAVARSVARPEEFRKRLALPDEDRVPGGVIKSIKTTAWTSAMSTYPGNMRESESTHYPFASVDTSSLLPSLHSAEGSNTELTLKSPSRESVVVSLANSAVYLKSHNNWEPSVRANGVLREVLAVPMAIEHRDGSPTAYVLGTADGSSRTASAHRVIEVEPQEILYSFPTENQAWRSHLGRVLQGSTLAPEDRTRTQTEKIRAATLPAKIVIGFEPDEGQPVSLSDAIEFTVGLTHVEPPRAWENGSKLDAQANAMLEDFRRLEKVSPERADYYAGMLTPDAAEQYGFSRYADVRAAEIMHTALRRSTRRIASLAIRRVTARPKARVKDIVDVATELALRGWSARSDRRAGSQVEGTRDALQRMFNTASVHKEEWRVTGRTPEQLLTVALAELDAEHAPGPAARELGVLGGWCLVVGRFAKREVKDSPNKSTLARVLETMIASRHGLVLLADAVSRSRQGQPVRAVTAEGQPVDHHKELEDYFRKEEKQQRTPEYDQEHGTDDWLRYTFMVEQDSEPSNPLNQEETVTPDSALDQAKEELSKALRRIEEAVETVKAVHGYRGEPLIDERGWNNEVVRKVVRRLDETADTIRRWGWTWEQTQQRQKETADTTS